MINAAWCLRAANFLFDFNFGQNISIDCIEFAVWSASTSSRLLESFEGAGDGLERNHQIVSAIVSAAAQMTATATVMRKRKIDRPVGCDMRTNQRTHLFFEGRKYT